MVKLIAATPIDKALTRTFIQFKDFMFGSFAEDNFNLEIVSGAAFGCFGLSAARAHFAMNRGF
jgi:hypothetical protein